MSIARTRRFNEMIMEGRSDWPSNRAQIGDFKCWVAVCVKGTPIPRSMAATSFKLTEVPRLQIAECRHSRDKGYNQVWQRDDEWSWECSIGIAGWYPTPHCLAISETKVTLRDNCRLRCNRKRRYCDPVFHS